MKMIRIEGTNWKPSSITYSKQELLGGITEEFSYSLYRNRIDMTFCGYELYEPNLLSQYLNEVGNKLRNGIHVPVVLINEKGEQILTEAIEVNTADQSISLLTTNGRFVKESRSTSERYVQDIMFPSHKGKRNESSTPDR